MDSSVQIRPYREIDEESVVELWRTVFPDPAAHNVPRVVIAQKVATAMRPIAVSASALKAANLRSS